MRFMRTICGWLALLAFTICATDLRAAEQDLAVRAQLIWGSDEHKPSDPNIKMVDAKLAETLRNVLKWKNYYECSSVKLNVAMSKAEKVRVSDKCEIEVTNLGKGSAEIKLYGKGKLVSTRKLVIGSEPLVVGGPDKNDTAWFVVVTKAK